MSTVNDFKFPQINNENKNKKFDDVSDDYHFIKYDNGIRVNIPRKEYEKQVYNYLKYNTSEKKDLTKKNKKMSKQKLASMIDRLYSNKKYLTLPPIDNPKEDQCFLNSSKIVFTNELISKCEEQFMKTVKPYTHQALDLLGELQDPNVQALMKLVEDVLVLVKLLASGKNRSDYAMALFVFTKLRLGDKPILNSDFLERLTEYYNIVMVTITQQDNDDTDKVEETFASFRDILNKYSAIKKSPIITKLYRFSMYALSLSLFSKIGVTFDNLNYSNVEAEALKQKYHLGPDFVYCLLDTVLFLCQRGYQCIKSGEISPLFHSPKTYEEFYNHAMDLIKRSKHMHNPEAFGDNEFKFTNDLDVALEKGQSIVKHAFELQMVEKETIRKVVNELYMIKSDLLTKSAAKEMRTPPFSLLLSGNSSIGKSSIMEMIFTHFGKREKLPIDSVYKYTRNAAANFWDGFSTSQWCIIFDDIAFMHPNKAPQGDPSLMEVIQLINAVPFTPDQASLEDKGKTPVRAKLVIASTNTEDLNAHYYFSCGSAVQRRFPYIIEPHVKAEYLADDSSTLDSNKCPPCNGYPDLWTYTIKKVKPSPIVNGRSGKAIITTIHSELCLKDFLLWLNTAITLHNTNQNNVKNSLDEMHLVDLCEMCGLPKTLCSCSAFVQQADEEGEVVEDEPNYFRTWWKKFRMFYFLGICTWYFHFLVFIGHCQLGYPLTGFCWFILTRLMSGWAANIATWIIRDVTGFAYVYDFVAITPFGRWIFQRLLWRLDSRVPNGIIRRTFRMAGRAAQTKYGNPLFLAWAAVYLGACAVLFRCRDTLLRFVVNNVEGPKSQNETVSSENIGTSPTPSDDDRENVWYKNDYELTAFDYTPEQIGSRGLTLEEFVKIVQNNVVHFTLHSDEEKKNKQTGAICLKGNIYLVNTHAIPNDRAIELKIINSPSKDGVSNNTTVVVYRQNFIDLGEDLSLIEIRGVCPKRDITKYLATTTFGGIWNGILLGRSKDGQLIKNPLKKILQTDAKWLPSVSNKHWEYCPHIHTQNGDCGSLAIAETPKGFVIVGIHYAGIQSAFASFVSPVAASTPLNSLIIDFIDKHFKPARVPSKPMLQADTAEATLGELHRKSPFRFLEHGECQVFGSFVDFRCQPKTTVIESFMAPYMVEHGATIKCTKPSMRGWEAKRKTLLDIMSMEHKFDIDVLDHIVEDFGNSIVSKLGSRIEELMVYDNFTAINGCAGVSYVDKMNRNTSAGFPWRRSKKYLLTAIDPVGQNLNPVKAHDEVIKRVDEMISRYSNGEMVHPVFTAAFKDEPVTFEKARTHATRVFMGAPFDWSIVVRKYCLSFIRLVQSNRMIFECGAGTIAQSDEWHNYRVWLSEFGESKIVAGDYSKFDKRMGSEIILAAFNLMIKVMENSKMKPEEIEIVRGIAYDTAFPMVDYFGDLVQFNGCNPSGHPLTVIINSLANSIYMRYCYFLLNPEHEISSFQDKIHLMTYGDDNIMGVSDDAPWFNHTAIADVLSTYGIKYTMAEKDAVSVPYISIDDASFLKRKWVYCPDMRKYLCKIDEDSIFRSLTVWVPSKSICRQQQAIAVMNSAVMEYFFYGRVKFEEKRKFFLQMIHDLNLGIYYEGKEFPTWIQLSERYEEASKRLLRPNSPGLNQKGGLVGSLLLDIFNEVDTDD